MNKVCAGHYEIFSKFILCLSVVFFSLFATEVWAAAPAGDATMVINVMCAVINQLTGPIGKAITIIILISLGIMLLLGKVTWGVAIALAVGMGVIFGAKDLVNLLTGGQGALCQ